VKPLDTINVVLDIQALTRHFGALAAVDSLTLSVNAGEVFGLLGSNQEDAELDDFTVRNLADPAATQEKAADGEYQRKRLVQLGLFLHLLSGPSVFLMKRLVRELFSSCQPLGEPSPNICLV
jgi:hypothetical protein